MPTYAARVACALLILAAPPVFAQSRPSVPLAPIATARGPRPVPGPVVETPEFTRAVERGTRTRSGRPGAGYWVQHARYSIDVTLDPAKNRVSGRERVVYVNHSPDTLGRIAVHLRQNAFAAGNPRRQSAPITGGVTLGDVSVDGRTVPAKSSGTAVVPITDVATHRVDTEGGYTVDGTVMWIPLRRPLLPHDSATLTFAWSYSPPLSPSDGREGREDHDLYVLGYWYPEIAVYDDVHGWVADPYLLEAEFYMDPADYDVRVTVPRGWVVGATGTLENAGAVLSSAARARLAAARRTGEVVHVVRPGDVIGNTWHFVAPDVRDFAWGASSQWVWDATRALVGRDTVNINSFYRRSAPAAAWAAGGARFTRDAIQQLSAYLWDYPWPTMTSMEGVLDSGGMEYPMLTVMQPWADTLSLAGDLMHETGHMWFPMQVGSNETRHPWMDEGFTQFDVAQAMRAQYGEPRTGGRPGDSEPGQRALYLDAARSGHDMTLMWPGDLYPSDLYFIMYYDKTAQVLAALRGVVGEEVFHRAFREYGRRWIGKHPYPFDFFNTIADVAQRDLGWFWTTWFYQPWPLDQAVASVTTSGDSSAITIEDRGLAPMPVDLAITRADGSVQRMTLPADVWLTGARRHVVSVKATPAVVKVEIDPSGSFPDMDRANQVWQARRSTITRAAFRAKADSLVRAYLADSHAPGASFAVIRGTDTLAYGASGLADVEAARAARAATIYEIGSNTKQFTSAAIMRLVEQGKVKLDDDLSKYVPQFPLHGKTVTIRELLTHTSGIHDYTTSPAWPMTWNEPLSPDAIIKLVAADTFDFAPGTKYRYDNTGYVLLGMVIEKATGEKYARYLDEQFFTPLGLRATSYCPSHTSDPAFALGYTKGPAGTVRSPFLDLSHPFAAGALCSTVGDFAKWQRALAGGSVVSPASYALMSTAATLTDGQKINYGFGLVPGLFDGHKVVSHTGGIPGFATAAAYVADDSLSVVVFTNYDRESPQRLVQNLLRVAYGDAPIGAPAPAAAVPLPPSVRDAVVGRYTLQLPGGQPLPITFFLDGTRLMAQARGQGANEVHYLGNDAFGVAADPSLRFTFTIEGGTATKVTLLQGGAAVQGERQP